MEGYIKWMDGNSKLLKVILALPILDILWVIYRLFKSIEKGHVLGIILAIILLFFAPILWLIDIITLLLLNKVLWFG